MLKQHYKEIFIELERTWKLLPYLFKKIQTNFFKQHKKIKKHFNANLHILSTAQMLHQTVQISGHNFRFWKLKLENFVKTFQKLFNLNVKCPPQIHFICKKFYHVYVFLKLTLLVWKVTDSIHQLSSNSQKSFSLWTEKRRNKNSTDLY